MTKANGGPNSVPAKSPAVSARGLRKQYHGKAAVDGIDLDIERGEVFALLGPNGAGKITTVEILEGRRRRDGGEVICVRTFRWQGMDRG